MLKEKHASPAVAKDDLGKEADVNYQALAQFRFEIRKYLAFSEAAAAEAGVTPHQYQALVAIKGFSRNEPLSVGDLAALMFIRHHTAVSLVDRMAKLGLLTRVPDPSDKRRVFVTLTNLGEEYLRSLASVHVEELRREGTTFAATLQAVMRQPK
ncbi:MarR family winged helix-turn-helix transcriptional regulator [Labrys okinawensis]|uniref:MarR family winged helix-turn-helix transcriptional regulator n=1 Tax=Labrys okinawensis TaxID=346911 RepID=UPI0039BCEBC7